MNEPIDLTPFWCLMAYDEYGRRMYAYGVGGPYDPSCHYPSTIGALTHRPREARKFASAADAEAARPELEPWVERYVADWRKHADGKTFTATLPLRPYFECELIAVYPDGSGLAREEMRNAMKTIGEYEDKARTLRRFIQKHEDTLAGMSWRVSFYGDPAEIEIGPRAYRGRYVQAEEIAALWAVQWKRKKEEYPRDGWLIYDWVAQLDGIRLKLDSAEQIKLTPVDRGEDGTVVRLPRGKRIEVAP